MIRLAPTGIDTFRYIWAAGPLGQDVGGGTVTITHNKGKYANNVVARYAYNTVANETNSTSYQSGRNTIIWPTAFDGYAWTNINLNSISFNSRSPVGGNAGANVSILIDIFFL
jgi:hypothetical protein